MLSMLASFIVASTIYFNKRLRGHQGKLVMFLSIANFCSVYHQFVWAVDASDYFCYLGQTQMFRWSFGYFYPESDYQMIDAIKYLVKANLTAFEVSQVMAICLNAFMCIDCGSGGPSNT